jgi:hypothetical protein
VGDKVAGGVASVVALVAVVVVALEVFLQVEDSESYNLVARR